MTATVVIIISIIISAFYYGLIIFFTVGWFRNKPSENSPRPMETMVSAIIPFRNEEGNMLPLLKSLSEQSFPKELFEVILVDDHSDDQSQTIAKKFISDNSLNNFRVLSLSDEDGFSKKAALKKGIENSSGSLIVSTDADCIFGRNWLHSVVSFYEKQHCRLISGSVIINSGKSFFSKLQSLEFLSLIASGAGAIGAGHPIMANGANLCFERSLYKEFNGYKNHSHYASGDDVFLLHEAKKNNANKKSIFFLKDREAIVVTKGMQSFKDFMNQRIRWTSKSTGYKDTFTLFTAGIVFLFNLQLPLLLLCGCLSCKLVILSVAFFAGKCMADFPLLMAATCFAGKPGLMHYYLPMQLIYPFYTIAVALSSLFLKFEWKGRKVRR